MQKIRKHYHEIRLIPTLRKIRRDFFVLCAFNNFRLKVIDDVLRHISNILPSSIILNLVPVKLQLYIASLDAVLERSSVVPWTTEISAKDITVESAWVGIAAACIGIFLAEREWAISACMVSQFLPFSGSHSVCILCQPKRILCQPRQTWR